MQPSDFLESSKAKHTLPSRKKVRYTVFHVRSAETNLTLILSSPKSFVCNLPDSGRNVTRPNQGLSMGRRENLGMRLPCRQSVLEILLAG